MSNKTKVNLELLKRLHSELEKSVETAASMTTDKDITEYITELARASGLAGVLMQEAHMVIKDIYQLIRVAQGPETISDQDMMAELEKIIGSAPKRNTN
jgi:Mg-chelatase subunit ChlI